MKIRILFITLLTWASIGFISFADASEALSTADFNDLYNKAIAQGQKYGNDHVLVVYDMDNTLLAMNQDLGSDQWFDWQASLLAQAGDAPARVASDIGSLLSLQQKLFMLSGMHLTQNELPELVKKLKNAGFSQFVLSSRGPEMREPSLRELKRSQLNFDWSTEPVSEIKTYLPYDPNAPENNCLTKDDIQNLKLGPARSVSIGNGIVLSSGQHKGAILKTILCKSEGKFKSIIFIDDKKKNVDAVQAAYLNSDLDLVTYRYSEEDGKVLAFQASDKSQVNADWNFLKNALTQIFK